MYGHADEVQLAGDCPVGRVEIEIDIVTKSDRAVDPVRVRRKQSPRFFLRAAYVEIPVAGWIDGGKMRDHDGVRGRGRVVYQIVLQLGEFLVDARDRSSGGDVTAD